MAIARVPLTLDSVKVRVKVGPGSEIRQEMDERAITTALWLALKSADDAGFDSLVDEIGRVHLMAVQQFRHVVSA